MKQIKIQLKSKYSFSLNDYKGCHDKSCKDKFILSVEKKAVFDAGALGLIVLPVGLFAYCPSCEAKYWIDEFEESINDLLAAKILFHNGIMTKQQIKYLRQHFDFTQSKMAEFLGYTDKSYYNRFESEKSKFELPEPQQIKLKIFFMEKLKESGNVEINIEQVFAAVSRGLRDNVLELNKLVPSKKELEHWLDKKRA